MQDLILLILLVVVIAVVIAQIIQLKNHAEKPLILGLVLGIIGVIGYYKLQLMGPPNKLATDSEAHDDKYYNFDLGNACREACKVDCTKDDIVKPPEKKEEEIKPKLPNYRDDGLHPHYPTNFDFDQNKFGDIVVPDGWLAGVEDLKVSTNKYDIDGQLINGNTADPGKSPYTDQLWKLQSDPSTVDAFTAANLHMSRKPREAFYFQSRWGVNSLRPWIAQELDDNANKIWWEDNPELDQYM
jgi:hypothetical protein